MILSIDCESSGLIPKGAELGSSNYPWPVSIGAVLFGFDGHDRAVFHSRIRSEGRSIGSGAQAVHGVSTRDAARSGIPEKVGLSVICNFAAEAQFITGFNVRFDRDVLASAIIRIQQDPKKLTRPGLQVVDLLKPCVPFCKLPSEHESGSYRWPKLDDAMARIRNERPRQGHHDALRDACRAKRLFLSLLHRGVLDIPGVAA